MVASGLGRILVLIVAMSLVAGCGAASSSQPAATPVASAGVEEPTTSDTHIRAVVDAIDELAALVAGGADGDATGTWANETSTALFELDAVLTDARLADFREALLAMLGAVADGSDQAPSVKLLLGMREDLATLIDEAALTTAPTVAPAVPKTFAKLTKRSWAKLVKNPDAYTGKGYQVWACVTQFDAATGVDVFRGDASYAKLKYWYKGANAMFLGEAARLADVVTGDIVFMSVTGAGSYSYDTQAGGNTTVPMFRVVKIKRVKGSCG